MTEALTIIEILLRDIVADLVPVTDLHIIVLAILLVLFVSWGWEPRR